MDAEESIAINGMQPKDDEMKWNHKKRTKDRFLLFCETVLNHERELLSETLNSSQESISENLAPEGPQNNTSIENSTFNSDSDGANGNEIYPNDAVAEDGGDSFNSVTCFCRKPFAGRPMIECSGCLTWYHMSCVKVKRKNIPEYYYCDGCKNNGMLSPSNALGTSTASSGEETTPSRPTNGTMSSNLLSPEGILYSTHQNQSTSSSMTMTAKPRKPKTVKKSIASSLMMNSDNIKNNNSNSDSKYLTKKSSTVNGKLKKIRQTKKMMRPTVSPTSSTTSSTKGLSSNYSSGYASSIAAATSLTALSLNHQVSPTPPPSSSSSLSSSVNNGTSSIHHSTNGNASAIENLSSNVLKSPIATINNNIYNTSNNGSSEVMETISTSEKNGDGVSAADKFNNKRLKLL